MNTATAKNNFNKKISKQLLLVFAFIFTSNGQAFAACEAEVAANINAHIAYLEYDESAHGRSQGAMSIAENRSLDESLWESYRSLAASTFDRESNRLKANKALSDYNASPRPKGLEKSESLRLLKAVVETRWAARICLLNAAENAERTANNAPPTGNVQPAVSNNNPYPQNTGASGATNKQAIEPAYQCITITREAHNWPLMDNRCPYAIEVAWCYQGLDCKKGNWGYSNLATIGAGKNKYASSFSNTSEHTLLYFACKGANTRPVEDSPTTSHCEP